MTVLLLVIGLIMFVGLVVVHEWGHFIVADKNGVTPEEFGIFFPPRIYKRKTKKGWVFSIGLLPLGGFVKLKGEHDSDTAKGSFGAANLWIKSKIMAAGVVMNLVAGLVILTIVALIGMPKLIDHQFTIKSDTKLINREVKISYVEPGSPAEKAGLKPTDQITDIKLSGYSPVSVTYASDLPRITKNFAGKTVDIYFVRDGVQKQSSTTLLSQREVDASKGTSNPKGYLGVIPYEYMLQKSTWSAPIVAVGFSAQITKLTFQGLGHALGGLGSAIAGLVTANNTARHNGQTEATAQVSGPVGIFYILKDGSALGIQYILLIVGIISLTLAIMNILPIPALDGGRLWITLFAHSIKKPLSAKTEEMVNAAGFFVLISLIILITIVDVHRY